jgi:hypothetical protein
LGKFRRVTVLVGDAPYLLTVNSNACCVLVKLAIAADAGFELGGFWLKKRGCHVPVILLSLDLMGVKLAYAPSLVTEALHEELFLQFPDLALLVQDFTVTRPRDATRTLPARLGEELRAALGPGAKKTPATMALLSPNGIEAEVILGCSGERSDSRDRGIS